MTADDAIPKKILMNSSTALRNKAAAESGGLSTLQRAKNSIKNVARRWPHKQDNTLNSSAPSYRCRDSSNNRSMGSKDPVLDGSGTGSVGKRSQIQLSCAGGNEHQQQQHATELESYSPKRQTAASTTGSASKDGVLRECQEGPNGQLLPGSADTLRRKKTAQENSYNGQNSPEQSENAGIVFLQHSGETKRCQLDWNRLSSLKDVKGMFGISFPTSLGKDFLHSANVKVYIQDPSKQTLFYELEDLKDLKDHSVLKLHEQQRPASRSALSNANNNHNNGISAPSSEKGLFRDAYSSHDKIALAKQQRQNGTRAPPVGHNRSFSFDQEDTNYFSESDADMPMRRYSRGPPSSRGYLSSSSTSRLGPGQDAVEHYYKQSGMCAPPKPNRLTNGQSGHKLSERDDDVYGQRNGHHRSASASGAALDFDGFGSQYSGDASPVSSRSLSLTASRSGSVTPIIDEETRARMDSMEQQLVSLSTLVRSALGNQGGLNKGVTESVYKDIQMLRREILGSDFDTASDSGSVSRLSDLSSDKGSNRPDNEFSYPGAFHMNGSGGHGNAPHFNAQTILRLRRLKNQTTEVRSDLKHLKTTVQLISKQLLRGLGDAAAQLQSVVANSTENCTFGSTRGSAHPLLVTARAQINEDQEKYRSTMVKLEEELIGLEQQVETLRQQVVNGTKKLRVAEIEQFTGSLTHIGHTAAQLKSQFVNLQSKLRAVMTAEMEKVVREEKFLKVEPERIDNALRRCKKLTNTMVTMKKLALVQDPAVTGGVPSVPPERRVPLGKQDPPGVAARPPSDLRSAMTSPLTTMKQLPPVEAMSPRSSSRTSSISSQSGSLSGSGSVLDSLLEELQTVGGKDVMSQTSTLNNNATAPKPSHGPREKRVGFLDQTFIQTEGNTKTENEPLRKSTYENDDTSSKPVSATASISEYGNSKVNGWPSGTKSPVHSLSWDEFSTPPSSPQMNSPVPGIRRLGDGSKYKLMSPQTIAHDDLLSTQINKSIIDNRYPQQFRSPPSATVSIPATNNIGSRAFAAEVNGVRRQRSRSGTPSSVTSEPPVPVGVRQPPAPPMRTSSSSRIQIQLSGGGYMQTTENLYGTVGRNPNGYPRSYNLSDNPGPRGDSSNGSRLPMENIYGTGARATRENPYGNPRDLRNNIQLENPNPLLYGGRKPVATPFIQTNAVDQDDNRFILKSASSSESINSQESEAPAVPPPPNSHKGAPPPLPPMRNKPTPQGGRVLMQCM